MPWSAWSECSAPCNAGVQTRSRTCTPPAFGGAECTGPHLQTRNCNTRPCGGECHVGHGIAAPALTPALHPLSPAAQCPDTMQYLTAEECRHSEGRCPWICQDLGAGVACTAQCQPGCHCPAGLLLQNGTCVPPSHCLCHHRGHLYQPGDITALDTCNNWCGGHWGWGLGGSPHLHLLLTAPSHSTCVAGQMVCSTETCPGSTERQLQGRGGPPGARGAGCSESPCLTSALHLEQLDGLEHLQPQL